MSDIDTLAQFGNSFQTKTIVALITDKLFMEQVCDIVDPAFFDSEANQWIVKTALWYFSEYRNVPTKEVFITEAKKIPNEHTIKVSIGQQLASVYQNILADDVQYIKDQFLQFCKNQAMKNAILKSVDMLHSGRYDDIKLIVDKALHAGGERNLGHHWNTEFHIRSAEDARNPIATPWGVINGLTDGGLGEGELGCIVAGPGVGKSWVLNNLGAGAMRSGKKVAHYTLELSEKYVGLRYDTVFTGIEAREIRHHKAEVEKAMEQISGQVYIKYFPSRGVNVNSISAHMKRMMSLDFSPDIVIMDYADLMRSTEKSQAKHEELGYIYEELRGLLGEFKIPGWTASQVQRAGAQDDVIDTDKIAGAYSKIMICDFIMTISRKIADKQNNTARVLVAKNRFGPDGLQFPAIIDTTKGQVEIYDEDSIEGIAIRDRMADNENSVKRNLAQKLLDFQKTGEID